MELTFSTFDKKPLYLENHFKNSSCFLVLCGPSLNCHNLDLLKQPGIITFGLNNSSKTFRPNLWACVDHPSRFMISVWKDPTIMKFVPHPKHNTEVFDNYNWKEINTKVRDFPNVIYYHRNENFKAETYLTEKTVNWGNHKNNGGGRSIMMAAIKILYLLGFKNVFLLGCDFKMKVNEKNYSWDQSRSKGSVHGNNSTYKKMIDRYTQLLPYFNEANFNIYNCSPNSELKVFKSISYRNAIDMSLNDFPDVNTERVEGMYDRFDEKKNRDKRIKEEKKKRREQQKLKKLAEEKDSKIRKTLDSDRGLVYYNIDKGAIVRMAVSLSTCVNHYPKERIVILSDYKGYSECEKIANYFGVNLQLIETEKLDRKEVLLNKCLLHKITPFENTIMLDSDTIVLNKFEELHDMADKYDFVVAQFCNWTNRTRTIKKRILEWKSIYSELTDDALADEYPSVNTGVYAFRKDSELMKNWFDIAKHGTHMFIPDEQSCHLLLPKYKSKIVSHDYNCSCKYDVVTNDTKVVHYHGRKHCRVEIKDNMIQFLFNSNLWYDKFNLISNLDFIENNIEYDRQLRKYLRRINEHNNSNGCN